MTSVFLRTAFRRSLRERPSVAVQNIFARCFAAQPAGMPMALFSWVIYKHLAGACYFDCLLAEEVFGYGLVQSSSLEVTASGSSAGKSP